VHADCLKLATWGTYSCAGSTAAPPAVPQHSAGLPARAWDRDGLANKPPVLKMSLSGGNEPYLHRALLQAGPWKSEPGSGVGGTLESFFRQETPDLVRLLCLDVYSDRRDADAENFCDLVSVFSS
jgi:hypothetical protein